jgi:hypothetical protein
MSSTLRDATEHTVHTLTDLVSDAMQHIDIPHLDLARVPGRRRRSPSPTMVVAFGAAMVVLAVVVVRALRGRASARGDDNATVAPSQSGSTAAAAA